jgi:hypothetical protein
MRVGRLGGGVEEGRRSFLKKRTKKLFLMVVPNSVPGSGRASLSTAANHYNQKFFASFFQKRSACLPGLVP